MSHADRAHIGEVPASSGTTVYDGDRLSTEANGVLRLNAGTTALHLAPQTSLTVRLTDSGQSTQVELAAGMLVFSVANPPAVAVHANNAWIRPASNAPTVAHIRIVNPKELRISAQRGSLQFSYEGESALIPEGVAYRVLLDPDDDSARASSTAQVSKKSGKARRAFLLILIGAAAGIGIPILIHSFESPDHPGTIVHTPINPGH